MNEKQRQEIRKHGENLQRIFNISGDPIALCKRLRRVENEARTYTTAQCNGELDFTEKQQEVKENVLLKKVNKILNNENGKVPIFINGDPRGYALKIDNDWVRKNKEKYPLMTDWGGYGIIAPEIKGR